jgi:hypothetical protein
MHTVWFNEHHLHGGRGSRHNLLEQLLWNTTHPCTVHHSQLQSELHAGALCSHSESIVNPEKAGRVLTPEKHHGRLVSATTESKEHGARKTHHMMSGAREPS